MSPSHKEEITLVIRDNRSPGWYWLDNEIVDDYRPLIGCVGMDIYNLYARRSMNDTQKSAIPREIVRLHLSISPSTLTEHNYILEWCELIHIQRKHHRVHSIHMLHPQSITPDQLEKIRQNVLTATGGTRPRKPKYPRLRTTLLKRLDNWQSLNSLWDEYAPDAKQAITIVKASELQATLPGFESDSIPPEEYANLIEQIVTTFANGTGNTDAVTAEAERLLETYGSDTVTRQLEMWPQRAAVATASERGLEKPMGLFIWAVKTDAPQWTEKQNDIAAAAAASAELPEAEPPSQMETQWTQVLGRLKGQMTKATFDTCLKSSVLVDHSNGQITVAVASNHAQEWLENRLHDTISRAVKDVIGDVEIIFTVAETA